MTCLKKERTARAAYYAPEKANKKTGCINTGTPHVLRHTFCTKCISAGMDVKSAQHRMGHSDASIALNIYTDKVMDKICESMELLEKRCN